MKYPGRVIRQGEPDAGIVRAVKLALNEKLALQGTHDAVLPVDDPHFDAAMLQAVRMFQARNVDSQGAPLVIDGKIGPLTWEALFGTQSVPVVDAASDELLETALRIAAGEQAAQVREQPLYSNRGPRVDEYQRRTGINGSGQPWCACFLYWCFDEAASALGRANPVIRTAGCLDHWNRAGRRNHAHHARPRRQ